MIGYYKNIHIITRISILCAVLIASLGALFYFAYPLRAVSRVNEAIIPMETGEIRVDFNRPIVRQNIHAVITPDVPGEWRFAKPLLYNHLYSSLIFIPYQTFPPNSQYSINLGNIKAIGSWITQPIDPVSFKIERLPEIEQVQTDLSNPLNPNAEIIVKFDKTKPALGDISVKFDPKTDFFIFWNKTKTQMRLVPKKPFTQGAHYKLNIERSFTVKNSNGAIVRTEPKENILEKNFSIVEPAGILEVAPSGDDVLPSAPINLRFAKPMNKGEVEKEFKINPEVDLMFQWADDQTVKIAPNTILAFGQKYDISLSQSIHAIDGSFLPQNFNQSFTTVGRVSASETDPADYSQGVPVSSSIIIKFNQAVDRNSFQQNLKIHPEISADLEWRDEKTIAIKPKNLDFNALYSISINQGVKSIVGAPESEYFSFSFLTEPEILKLNVALDYQDKKLSCEVAALKMALLNKNVAVHEEDIMAIVGFDRTKRSNGVWGNPNLAFVGDINGRQNTTGYGVHWDPIARAAKNWRPNSESFTDWTLEKAITEVAAGNPIEFWGTLGPAYQDFWKSPAGKDIRSWKGEHTRLLIGFIGSRTDPQTLIINDPLAGTLFWSKEKFLENWGRFDYSGVVIR